MLLQFFYIDKKLKKTQHVRRFPQPHCVVALAHDLFASAIQKLGQPANTAHKEAGVDVEEYDSRVAVGILPVGQKRHLSMQKKKKKKVNQLI